MKLANEMRSFVISEVLKCVLMASTGPNMDFALVHFSFLLLYRAMFFSYLHILLCRVCYPAATPLTEWHGNWIRHAEYWIKINHTEAGMSHRCSSLFTENRTTHKSALRVSNFSSLTRYGWWLFFFYVSVCSSRLTYVYYWSCSQLSCQIENLTNFDVICDRQSGWCP